MFTHRLGSCPGSVFIMRILGDRERERERAQAMMPQKDASKYHEKSH